MRKLSKADTVVVTELMANPGCLWVQPWADHNYGPNKKISACEEVILNMPKRPLVRVGNWPRYNFALDIIEMPPIENFYSAELYYASFFHELAHAVARYLDLGLLVGVEEVFADLTAHLCNIYTNIAEETKANTAAYVRNSMLLSPTPLGEIALLSRTAANYMLKTDTKKEPEC